MEDPVHVLQLHPVVKELLDLLALLPAHSNLLGSGLIAYLVIDDRSGQWP